MTLSLYTLEPPSGRCLFLIKELDLVARLTHSQCIQVAMALFENRHPPENPATVEILDGHSIEGLKAICSDLGIEVRTIEPDETKVRLVIPGHVSVPTRDQSRDEVEEEALHREAERITPTRDELRSMIGRLPPSSIDRSMEDDEMPC